MQIRPIDTDICRDRRRFILFPFSLYYQDPYWVPPFISDMRLLFERGKHPFYRHSDAQFLVAESEGQVVGRLAVLKNRPYCEYHKEEIAFFYYFEAIDDQDVANGLFKAAEDWARQQGCATIYGPRGFQRANCIGQLVEGFDLPPATGMIYNPPYYERLFTKAGFHKETDHYSGMMTRDQHLPDRVHEIAERVKQRGNFWVKTFTGVEEMTAMIPMVNIVHHEAFKDNPGYYPSNDEEFEMLAKDIIAIADPKLIKVVMKGNDIAGFIIATPNIVKAIRRTRGSIYPFGWIDLMREKKRTRIIDINGVGLLPKYQGLGNNALLYVEIEKTLRERDAEKAEIIQVDERNFRSKSDMETMGVIWNKTHRTFKKSIEK
ncbi:GNAT family N-acetyltransferase [bacterium]|nr:MAG: GNAT family N-acetyltransferase [bacterium]